MIGNNLVFKSAPIAGNYTVTVTAPGGIFGTNNHRVLDITVTGEDHHPPDVTAGGSADVYEGSVGRLEGTAVDPDVADTLTYAWTHNGAQSLGITIADDTALSTTFEVTGDVASDTAVTFTLAVSDGTPPAVTASTDVNIQDSSGAFVTTWETDNPQTTVGFAIAGANPVVDWGDGSERTGDTGVISHTYAEAGQYRITVDGSVSRLYHVDGLTTPELLRYVDQWGDIEWSSMEDMFYGASNMEYRAPDTPDLSRVTTMESMFSGASSFNGDISSWDVSAVTDMDFMFFNAISFDGDISAWDVSKVTHMTSMFQGASLFSGNISAWDVSKVTHMTFMFNSASSFNSDLSGWNVSAVLDMNSMFEDAADFNGDLSGWDVSAVTDMSYMFSGAEVFDRPLNGWDVSKVTNMDSMFEEAFVFDRPLNGWDVSKVTDMYYMFSGASSFNGDISSWNVSAVTDMSNMFSGASSFNQPLDSWNVSAVTDMGSMFSGASSFEQNLGSWYVVPADTGYDATTETTLVVTAIAAQNSVLDGHSPSYGIGTGGNFDLFDMIGNNLVFKSAPIAGNYTVTVTAPGGIFGTNNHRVLDITVTGEDHHPPDVTAGGSADVYEGSVGRLEGTAVDPDVADTLTYAWTHNGAQSLGITIADDTALSTTFEVTGDVASDTAVTFTLAVSDGTPPAVTASTDVNIQDSSGAFVTTWETDNPQTTVGFAIAGTNPVVDWGDGSERTSGTGAISHTYAEAGQYRITVDGSVIRLYHDDGLTTPELLRYVDQWGGIEWSSMQGMFHGASNMEYRAPDTPDLSRVTTMESMFSGASSFNARPVPCHHHGIHVLRRLTHMTFMFNSASSFNSDLSGWNVSAVLDMGSMFSRASSFEQNLGSWYVVPADTVYDATTETTLVVTAIAAQNSVLDGHSPSYGIGTGTGGNFDLFDMIGNNLVFKSAPIAGDYKVNVTASGSNVFENGNNWRTLTVTVTGQEDGPLSVDAGPDQRVLDESAVALSGTGLGQHRSDVLVDAESGLACGNA